MEKVKVSVIMGTYNEKIQWVEECINSILTQTYKNIEFIIVLDNPNNEELKKYIENVQKQDSRIVVVKNEENLGLVKTLNKALNYCTGDLIARMDADDIALKNRFSIQVKFMEENKDVAMVGTKVEFIDGNGRVLSKDKYRPTSYEEIKSHLRQGNAFAHPTLMYRKDMIMDIGGYKEVPLAEDYYLATEVITKGYKVANLEETLLMYRVREGGISKENKEKQFLVSQYIKQIYNKNLKGDNCEFDNTELDNILKNEDLLKNTERYLMIVEKLEEKFSVNNIFRLLCFSFKSKYNFNLVYGKLSAIAKRKLVKVG